MTTTTKKSNEPDYQAEFDDINQRYKNAETTEEKFIILGGDPKKLDGHSLRKQREMCIELKTQFNRKYRPFIK
ncbi:hypothetical protein [Aliivibrio fischeri]|uniref:hypothetical protein n=1 Tax=Aliivibrio fischeri TaxID=668 RepID=UPI003F759A3C